MRYAGVAIDSSARALDRMFTYLVPEGMEISAGDMVRVPFGNREAEGFVLETFDETDIPGEKLKPISAKIGRQSAILPELMELMEFMKRRYLCTAADALRCMIPPQMRLSRVKEKTQALAGLSMEPERALSLCARAPKQQQLIRALSGGSVLVKDLSREIPGAEAAIRALREKGIVEIGSDRVLRQPRISDFGHGDKDPVLTTLQQSAVDELTGALDTGGSFLLYGVTGSGKTEVYIKLIREVLRRGRGAIILVPEIALTPQTVSWFHARFGDLSAVIHSRLSAGERYDEWERIRLGQARVVIGARSAVFAPVERPGAIIVDEEHEGAYISEKHPRYDAREIARERCRLSGGVMVLGSATPSIASFMRTQPRVRPENRLTLIELGQRALGRPMPECEIVDMREELAKGNKGIFSAKLTNALKTCLEDGKQAMLLINRRGHSTFVSCRACGYVVKCDACDVSMTFHLNENALRCHYCGASRPVPEVCPKCGSHFIKYFGAGTQKVEEEVKRLFPQARVMRMDMDTTQGKDAHAEILEAFRRGEANVLVGTQMIAKGLDFPNVTLVGAVAADTTLNLPDYRSAERTFQLLTQAAGRAGRADSPGRVIIQTYTPDAYALQCASKQDYTAFYRQEAEYRRRSLYPPFTMIVRIVYASGDERASAQAALDAQNEFSRRLKEACLQRQVLSVHAGEAPIKRIKGLSRHQLLVKIYSTGNANGVIEIMTALEQQPPEGVSAELEIDPANLF